MATSMLRQQRGFTLIEMSIVLVIIGLIIGGILKGQELIESSRQKNLISQIDRIRAAQTSFIDRFKGRPGDFSRVGLLPNNTLLGSLGNDSGIIGTDTGTTIAALASLTASNTVTNENVQFWNQLLAADLVSPGTITNTTIACFSGICGTASPLPPSAFPQSGLTLQYGSHPGGTVPGGTAVPKLSHWLILSRFVAGALAGGATDGVLSPARAFQVDNKYDDGSAATDNIRTGFVGTGCGGAAADYTAGETAVGCHLLFTLD